MQTPIPSDEDEDRKRKPSTKATAKKSSPGNKRKEVLDVEQDIITHKKAKKVTNTQRQTQLPGSFACIYNKRCKNPPVFCDAPNCKRKSPCYCYEHQMKNSSFNWYTVNTMEEPVCEWKTANGPKKL